MEQPRTNKKYTIIIAILSIFLVAAIGVIVYLTLFAPKEEVKQNTQNNQAKTEESEVAVKKVSYCAEHEKMCFEYPEDWTLSSTPWKYDIPNGGPDAELDRVTLVARDKTVRLTLQSGISGIGGACFPEDAGKVSIVKKKATTINDYKADNGNVPTAYAMAIVRSNKEETEFTPVIGLTTLSALIDGTSKSACDVTYFGIVEGRNSLLSQGEGYKDYGGTQFVTGAALGQTADMEKEVATKTYGTFEEAKKALESESYKQAFDIIASAHYK